MVRESFKDLMSCFDNLDSALRPKLKPGANEHDISTAEDMLGVSFPSELRELLLLANGQHRDSVPLIPRIRFQDGELGRTDAAWLCEIDELVKTTRYLRQEYDELKNDGPFAEIGPAFFHDRFINFTTTGNASSLVIDLLPRAEGHVGQITMVSTQPFQLAVLSPSLDSFLKLVVEGFRNSRFTLESQEYGVWAEP